MSSSEVLSVDQVAARIAEKYGDRYNRATVHNYASVGSMALIFCSDAPAGQPGSRLDALREVAFMFAPADQAELMLGDEELTNDIIDAAFPREER